MTADNTVEVLAVNLHHRLVLLADDRLCDIDSFYDFEGDETHDLEFAVTCVAQIRDTGKWISVNLQGYDNNVLH